MAKKAGLHDSSVRSWTYCERDEVYFLKLILEREKERTCPGRVYEDVEDVPTDRVTLRTSREEGKRRQNKRKLTVDNVPLESHGGWL